MIIPSKNRSFSLDYLNIPGGLCFFDGQRPFRDGTQYGDTDPMNVWEDLSGANNDVSIGVAEAMPLYKSNAINGQGGANTVGRDNYLDFSGKLSVITCTVYIVAYFPVTITAASNPEYILGVNDTVDLPRTTFAFGAYTSALSNETISIEGRNASNAQRSYCIKSNVPAGNHIITFSRDAGGAYIYLDGVDGPSQATTGGPPSTVNVPNCQFERFLRGGATPARAFQGYVCGLYIYSRFYSEESAENRAMLNYLSNRFAIELAV